MSEENEEVTITLPEGITDEQLDAKLCRIDDPDCEACQ